MSDRGKDRKTLPNMLLLSPLKVFGLVVRGEIELTELPGRIMHSQIKSVATLVSFSWLCCYPFPIQSSINRVDVLPLSCTPRPPPNLLIGNKVVRLLLSISRSA